MWMLYSLFGRDRKRISRGTYILFHRLFAALGAVSEIRNFAFSVRKTHSLHKDCASASALGGTSALRMRTAELCRETARQASAAAYGYPLRLLWPKLDASQAPALPVRLAEARRRLKQEPLLLSSFKVKQLLAASAAGSGVFLEKRCGHVALAGIAGKRDDIFAAHFRPRRHLHCGQHIGPG